MNYCENLDSCKKSHGPNPSNLGRIPLDIKGFFIPELR